MSNCQSIPSPELVDKGPLFTNCHEDSPLHDARPQSSLLRIRAHSWKMLQHRIGKCVRREWTMREWGGFWRGEEMRRSETRIPLVGERPERDMTQGKPSGGVMTFVGKWERKTRVGFDGGKWEVARTE